MGGNYEFNTENIWSVIYFEFDLLLLHLGLFSFVCLFVCLFVFFFLTFEVFFFSLFMSYYFWFN